MEFVHFDGFNFYNIKLPNSFNIQESFVALWTEDGAYSRANVVNCFCSKHRTKVVLRIIFLLEIDSPDPLNPPRIIPYRRAQVCLASWPLVRAIAWKIRILDYLRKFAGIIWCRKLMKLCICILCFLVTLKGNIISSTRHNDICTGETGVYTQTYHRSQTRTNRIMLQPTACSTF